MKVMYLYYVFLFTGENKLFRMQKCQCARLKLIKNSPNDERWNVHLTYSFDEYRIPIYHTCIIYYYHIGSVLTNAYYQMNDKLQGSRTVCTTAVMAAN